MSDSRTYEEVVRSREFLLDKLNHECEFKPDGGGLITEVRVGLSEIKFLVVYQDGNGIFHDLAVSPWQVTKYTPSNTPEGGRAR